MDSDIIISKLRETIYYMKRLDIKRGEIKYDRTTKECSNEKQFTDAVDFDEINDFLKCKYNSLNIFTLGFKEFMKSKYVGEYEKIILLYEVHKIARECDNISCFHGNNLDLYELDYWDEKSFYYTDLIIDEEGEYWYEPDLESYKAHCDKDNNVVIFYKYSYYIISIAKLIVETINTRLPFYSESPEKPNLNISKDTVLKIYTYTQNFIDCTDDELHEAINHANFNNIEVKKFGEFYWFIYKLSKKYKDEWKNYFIFEWNRKHEKKITSSDLSKKQLKDLKGKINDKNYLDLLEKAIIAI